MAKKKKIAFLIDTLKRAGAQKVVLDILTYIDKNKFDVYLIYWRSGDFFDSFKSIKGLKMIKLKNCPKSLTSNVFDKGYIFLKQHLELRGLVKKYKFDVIHSHLLYPDIHNHFLNYEFKSFKAISTKHDTNYYTNDSYGLIGRLFDSNFDEVTVCSKSVYDILDKYSFFKNVKIIYNGINFLELEKLKKVSYDFIHDDKFNIICVGRLTEQKGYDNLLKFMSVFVKKVPKSHLYIAGDGEKKDELLKMSSDLSLNSYVSFLGSRTDVYELMKSCDLFMLLSNWEAFGIVILEALACNLPVVVSDLEGPREILVDGESGFLVDKTDYEGISDKVVTIVKKGFDIEKSVMIEIKRKFDIKKIVKQYETLYM